MRTRFLFPAALLVGVTALAPAQPPGAAAGGPDKPGALGAVPTDSFAFLTVNVGKLWANPDFKPLRDWAAAQKGGTFDSALGVPPADVERVTLFVPVADAESDFAPLVLVTTRAAYNEARVLKALARGAGDEPGGRAHVSGRVVGLGRGSEFAGAALIDDRNLLLVPKPALRGAAGLGLVAQLMAPKKDGRLAAALAGAATHDLAFGIDVGSLSEFVGEGKGPDEFAPYRALFKARTATFTADFDKTARGTFTLAFADEADAKRAAPVLQEGLDEIAGMYSKIAAGNPDRINPLERLFLETTGAVLKGTKVQAAGATVTATAELPHPEVIAKLAVALPKSVRDSADEARAKNNLKQLALAMYNFEATYGAFPGDVYPPGEKAVAWSWRVQLLPYVEQVHLYNQLDLTKPWDDPANLKALEKMDMPKVFELPGRPAPKGQTYFRVFTLPKTAKGKDRPWLVEGEKGPAVTAITDGTSNTFMIVEANEAVPWYKPDVLAYDGVLPLPPLGDKSGRFLAAFGDGSVRSLRRDKLDEKTLRALVTISGGEVVELPK
jgi:hypothetical protein